MNNNEKRLRQRLRLLFQQLELYKRYPEDFEKVLGEAGTGEWLNQVLGEINQIRKELNESK